MGDSPDNPSQARPFVKSNAVSLTFYTVLSEQMYQGVHFPGIDHALRSCIADTHVVLRLINVHVGVLCVLSWQTRHMDSLVLWRARGEKVGHNGFEQRLQRWNHVRWTTKNVRDLLAIPRCCTRDLLLDKRIHQRASKSRISPNILKKCSSGWRLRVGEKSTSDRAFFCKWVYVISTDHDIPTICDSDQTERRCLLGFGRRLRIPDDVT